MPSTEVIKMPSAKDSKMPPTEVIKMPSAKDSKMPPRGYQNAIYKR